MARGLRHTDTSPGWIKRELRAVHRELRELRAERRLRSSSFDGVIVPTESQEHPIGGGAVSASVTNFAPTLAGLYVIDQTVIVPSPFTAVVVNVTARAYAVNDQLTDDYLYCAAEVEGSAGPVTATALPAHAAPAGDPDEAAMNVAPLGTVLTGLTPGQTFDIRLWVSTATADWAAHTDNAADISGALTWFTE